MELSLSDGQESVFLGGGTVRILRQPDWHRSCPLCLYAAVRPVISLGSNTRC